MKIAGIIGALALLTYAGSAAAGDASCLWKEIPAADQQRAVEAVQSRGPSALSGDLFEEAGLTAAVQACGATAATGEPAGMALGGYVLEVATAQQLQRDFAVDPSRLEAAWNGLTRVDREGLIAFAGSMGGPNAGMMETVAATVMALDLPGENDADFLSSVQFRAASTFILGRAMRLANEPRF